MSHSRYYIGYVCRKQVFSRLIGDSGYSTGEQPTAGPVLEQIWDLAIDPIPSDPEEFDAWRDRATKALQVPEDGSKEVVFDGVKLQRGICEDLVVTISFNANRISLDGKPFMKLQSGGYPSGEQLVRMCDTRRNGNYSGRSLPRKAFVDFGYDVIRDSSASPANPKALEYFNQLQVEEQPIHTLLGLTDRISNCDLVCTKVREIYIGGYAYTYGWDINDWYTYSAGEDPDDRAFLGRLISGAVLPAHLFSCLKFPAWPRRARFWWIRTHICISLEVDLKASDNASAAIALLVKHIRSKPRRPPVVFGVVSDFFHCIIVRVTNAQDSSIVARSATLKFIPPQYATNPSTAGISALVRLGNLNAPDDTWFFYTALKKMWWSDPGHKIYAKRPAPNTYTIDTMRKVTILSLPFELITEIGSYLSSCIDLNSLAVLCKHTMSACIPLRRLPQLINTNPIARNEHGYILTSYYGPTRSGIDYTSYRMLTGRFVADHGDQKVLVLLAMENGLRDELKSDYERGDVQKSFDRAVGGSFYLPVTFFPHGRHETNHKLVFT
ncbi:hypothetical protein BDY19DRAFT_938321 [Irpex rosettiformis]|uniref:Uncharacterized protein n=1 Tax=Irpex rosettiformis TaxID=378272 RepID=A0ACB8U774_9APHY|nr:hypothetical protein BDY19DRAFT_938321 [Irpex rosettiformis]